MVPIVQMQNIMKSFPGVIANNDVFFSLYEGETHALVGENGAGKSTLMKILYGQQRADSGRIIINGEECSYNVSGARSRKIGMVYQNFMQIPDMSILDNIILGNAPLKHGFIDYKSAEEKVQTYLSKFKMKVTPKTKVKSLSVGERQKIEIIKTLFFDARILILDEPTAVLTPQETTELFDIINDLKKENRSIVFISHKLREVVEVADRITVMRKGKVIKTDWLRGEASENDIARAMIGKNDVELITNSKCGISGNTVLEANHLWYFDSNGIPKIKDLSLSVKEGEILGIGGVEGNGQSELIHILIGILKAKKGRILLGGEDITNQDVIDRRIAGMSFVSDDRMTEGLLLSGTMEDNIAAGWEHKSGFSNGIFMNYKKISKEAEKLIDEYGISGLSAGKMVGQLSGGNMQKVVLARELSRDPRIIIASQPTRGLDIGAINSVRQMLLEERSRGVAVILVSADLEELMSLSDRMIILYEGRISGEIDDISTATEEQIGLMMGGLEA